MPKRTSNSSVNSSIRQQTKSNDAGLSALLETQQASLGQLSSIRQLLELSKETQKNQAEVSKGSAVETQLILDELKEMGKTGKRHLKSDEERFKIDQAGWDSEAKKLAELAATMNTTGNVFQEMGKSFKERVQGVKEKTSIKDGGLKRTVMGALNVGGVFNKAIAKSEWMSQQRAMGFNPTKADAEGAYTASKDMKAHEAEIAKWQKKTGITDEEQMRRTPAGAKLLDKRISLGEQMTKFDMGAQRFDPTVKGFVNPDAAKTPTQSAAENTQNEEMQMEAAKDQHAMAELLAKIEENTRSDKAKSGPTPEKVKSSEGSGSFLDTIFSWVGDNFISIIKKIFSPKNLLKGLGRAFAIGALLGALWEGLTDGFDEYMKTGDIGKAIVAGLAGIVDFLTFGLFDKEKIKEVIGDMAAWVDDHIVKPISSFFGEIKDNFMNLLSNIGIPEISTGKLSLIPGVPEKIGPWYPFKDMASGKSPEAVAPTTAAAVEQKSADNAAAAIPESVGANNTNVVNAPVTNNTTQNQIIRAPIRNQDSSAGNYMRGRYA